MSDTTSILNHLIQTLKDGQEGFRAASENVKSADFKTLFSGFSLERSKFVGELQSLARSLGENEPATDGTVAGSLHRGWINIKSAIASQDEHAVLAECERGEDSAVAEYTEAIENPEISADVRETLSRQLVSVKAVHDKVRDLRDALASK